MRTMVLLRHEVPGGESHFDWLIDPGAGRGLITFRVGERIDAGGLAAFEAVRIGDHRRLYLDYEGSISGGRGSVDRLALGSIGVLAEQEDRLGLVGDLGVWVGAMVGVRVEGDAWRFRVMGG